MNEIIKQRIKSLIERAHAESNEDNIFDEVLIRLVVKDCCRTFNIWTFYDSNGEEIKDDDDSDVFQVCKVKESFGIES